MSSKIIQNIPIEIRNKFKFFGLLLTATGILNAFGPIFELRQWLANVLEVYNAILDILFWPLEALGISFAIYTKSVLVSSAAFILSAKYYRKLFIYRGIRHEQVYLPLITDLFLMLMFGIYIRQSYIYGQTAVNSDPIIVVIIEGLSIGVSFYFVLRIIWVAINIRRFRNIPDWEDDIKHMKLAVRDFLINLTITLFIIAVLLIAGAHLAFSF